MGKPVNLTVSLSAACFLLAACSGAESPAVPETDLPLFGDGYRGADDRCQRVGESAETNTYLDDAADLVGCPSGSSDAATFAAATGAREVAELSGYTLFSVPRR